MNLPLNVDFTGKAVVVTGAGGMFFLTDDKADFAMISIVLPIDCGLAAYS